MHRKGSCQPKGYLNATQFRRLQEALESAKLTHCGVDQEHQDAMKLYLTSWVVKPLESVLTAIRERAKKKSENE